MCGSSSERPLGTYSDHTRTPPHTAEIARASAATGSPHSGIPGKPTCTSSNPTRETMATPFHWLTPACATSYPEPSNAR